MVNLVKNKNIFNKLNLGCQKAYFNNVSNVKQTGLYYIISIKLTGFHRRVVKMPKRIKTRELLSLDLKFIVCNRNIAWSFVLI